ncbi:MAG: glyoxalase [Lachnospiraceae bacterium]|nr:glyoxalase [Lachnospiraceae bacterium]
MFDDKVLDCFVKNQLKLFPKKVVSNAEEAADFLEECMANVVKGKDQVIEYFEEEGLDMADGDILSAAEVFDVGDGRYLIVEA